MLVYATSLWLDRRSDRQRALDVIARWLTKKTNTPSSASSLLRTADARNRDGSRLTTAAKPGDSPELWAMRYSHADSQVSGRQWVTEIGLRRERQEDPIECTVLVQTSEISARVVAPVKASRPVVVDDLREAGLIVAPTPGRELMTLTDDADNAAAFLYGIEDDRRRHPYVLISADPSGKYLVNAERVLSFLTGLSDVVVIPPEADTYYLERVLGRQFAVWRGAVNVIFPRVAFPDRTFVETRRVRPEDIEEMVANGVFPETEILSIITHRTNLPHSWQAISLQRVQDTVYRHELEQRIQDARASGDQAEYVRLLEQSDGEQTRKIADLEGRIKELEQDVAHQHDIERRLRYDLDRAAESGTVGPSATSFNQDVRRSIVAVVQRVATPEQVLSATATLFPDRIEILPTAWKSARESQAFKESHRVFELLVLLATDYWEGMRNGKGDTEAGKVFGSAFAARESETVEGNPQARKRRTFHYDGQPIVMLRHLKLGRKDSVATTMRIHFHWDTPKTKVVIGHCGRHLDFD